jgi:hypothetical protein
MNWKLGLIFAIVFVVVVFMMRKRSGPGDGE